MPTPELSGWRKSSWSGPNNGNCVEIGFADHLRGVRDTKDRDHRTLVVGLRSWASFLDYVKNGHLDLSRS